MTAPIDTAYAALATLAGAALETSGLISSAALLLIDPANRWEPEGEETEVQTAAALFHLKTEPVRPLMGGGVRRWVVERQAQLELCATGPVADGEDSLEARMAAALDAVSAAAANDPTLTQTCERLELTGADSDDADGLGLKRMLTFTLRLRAGDPLGRTAP